jgi:glycosyltransferase involved in cell wall biosynthesis
LPRAIRCFQQQTYPNRELLIVADGETVRDLVPNDPRIRLIETDGRPWIGEKRNFACEHARGEIIVHWDDDDYSAPGRIADQVKRLTESGHAVTGYRVMRFTDGRHWWLYDGAPLFALGTSLCYRRDWWELHRFAALQVGEDNLFVAAASAEQQISVTEAGDLMFATTHPGNTSPRQGGANWKLIA